VKKRAVAATGSRSRSLSATREMGIIVVLAALVVLGFGLRLSGISTIGFAEDEINKLEAVRSYEQGDIRPNAEHPMLMKALMFVSMQAQHRLNQSTASHISDEAALRFPNILFGALTVIPLFLLTNAFFDRRTALVAAALWAFGINAITYNRIAKEDTLLVFFMLFAFYFFLRAKQTSGFDPQGKRKFYALSGASFGLMMASKYFPHYFGLNMLYYYLYRIREREPGEPRSRTPPLFYILIAVAFLIANPTVLLPQTWTYLQAYAGEQLLTHTGYLMGTTLYRNNVSSTPFWGTPFYFYALYLLIKLPLPILLAFVVGLVECVGRLRSPGHGFLLMMFLLWIVPYSFFGAKWLRYTLSLMPFVYMISAVGILALVRWGVSIFKESSRARARQIIGALSLLLFIILPAWTAYANRPHYAAYTNLLGGGRAGYYFPHDEFYDDGLREAIRFVCDSAPQGATIVHETPAVVRYYLEKFNRTDLQSRVLSDRNVVLESLPRPAYVIVQPGRTYFENREKMGKVRAEFSKVHEELVDGAIAVEIYRAEP
jgi:hypothetical protein